MSESTFPFAAEEAAPAASDRRKLALLALVGALVVAVLGYFVVMPALAGGDSEPTSVGVVQKPAKKTAKKPAAKAAAKRAPKAPAVPASYSDVSARTNPFRALWEPPVEAAPAAPAAPGTVTAPSGSTGYTAPSGSSTSVAGQKVSLMGIVEKDGVTRAQTRVGETVYQPKVGDVFATSYKLLAVSGKTATYLFGDEQFTLSVGQEVLK